MLFSTNRLASFVLVAALPLSLSQCKSSADTGKPSPADSGSQHDGSNGVDAQSHADASQDARSDVSNDSAADTAVSCTAHTQRFVTNAILLPQQRSDYAIDLNGDGIIDNQLGNVVGALTANNMDLQGLMDAAITSGDALLLLDETSNDPAFLLDPSCARAGLQRALPQSSPNFLDAGTFTADTTSQRGGFTGAITAGGAFDSTQPATMTTPVEVDIKLAILALVPVHVVGAHLSFTFSSGKVIGGKLQGALKKTDFDASVAPQIAQALNNAVQSDGAASQQTLQIFDIGCPTPALNFDGSPAAANDGKIALCELLDNSVIKNVLTPDVQMFDSTGNYHPNPANTSKDSLSLAVGFTAVPASF